MSLSDIVQVSIDLQTRTPQRIGFGKLMIVGQNATWGSATQRVKTFTSYDAVIDPADGAFNSTDPEAIAAALAFSQNPAPSEIKIGWWDPLETITDALNAIKAADPDWYGLVVVNHDPTTVQAIAAWAETQTVVFFTSTQDPNVLDAAATTDIAYLLKASGYARSAVLYHHDADAAFPEAAFAAMGLPYDPGSITWVYKDLVGVATSTLTASQETAALGKNASVFVGLRGLRMTRGGTVAAGEYIDVIRGRDWIVDTMQTRVLSLLVNSPKVPYTNAGIRSIAAEVRATLQTAVGRGVVATEPEFTVTVPDVLDVDPADRAARILRDVKFSARLAGAIHKIVINGTLTV